MLLAQEPQFEDHCFGELNTRLRHGSCLQEIYNFVQVHIIDKRNLSKKIQYLKIMGARNRKNTS